ncbi:DUF2589 domain-containing protein [Marinoscillum furvescens]|uniref:Uncharacterized protein DUF2589 n=1 Tax=Marinoscillum furvescens DSM 4134 TaxID=1122208 RepID=A0A3D9L6F2_MARFU|nr:DUF2589 domain-containing protein [Marinoscillum furvescens]REE01728.1 uncharacterized protein DUF2589 [Marinoscillum furvescens DSM 4134]
MSVLTLNDLLKSFMSAAKAANKELHDHEMNAFKDHLAYNKDNQTYEPKTLKVKLPQQHIAEGEDTEQPVDIPTGALASHQSMRIEELEMGFQCYYNRIGLLKSGEKKLIVDMDEAKDSSHSPIKINMKISSGNPSEGVARMHDALNRKIH